MVMRAMRTISAEGVVQPAAEIASNET